MELHVFHSQQCGACVEQLRVLRFWNARLAGVQIKLIDVDKSPAFEKAAGIEATPTLILVRDGQEVQRWVGFTPPAALQAATYGG